MTLRDSDARISSFFLNFFPERKVVLYLFTSYLFYHYVVFSNGITAVQKRHWKQTRAQGLDSNETLHRVRKWQKRILRPIKRSFLDVEHCNCNAACYTFFTKQVRKYVWLNTSQIYGGVKMSKSRIRFCTLHASKGY